MISRVRAPAIGILGIILLFVCQSMYVSNNMFIKILGIIIIITYYGISQRSSIQHRTDKKKYAILIGLIIIITATVAERLVTNDILFQHGYKTIPLNVIVYNLSLAPMIEESVFRQWLYGEWLYKWNKVYGAIIIGFVFIILHVPTNMVMWGYYTLSTTGLYVTYILSGKRLEYPLLVHIINNLIVVI